MGGVLEETTSPDPGLGRKVCAQTTEIDFQSYIYIYTLSWFL